MGGTHGAKHGDVLGNLRRAFNSRQITENYQLPSDACQSFVALYDGLKAMEADLHEHIHLENNILFPKSVRLEEGMNEAESMGSDTRNDIPFPARAQPNAEDEEAPPEPFSPVCYLKEFTNE